jgi:hypothetical protein
MVKFARKSEFISPADQYRKQIKKKEIDRNRKERYLNRRANSKSKTNLNALRDELSSILEMEQDGKRLNKCERLQKKVLHEQFRAGIRRTLEENNIREIEKHGGSILQSDAIFDPIETALEGEKRTDTDRNALKDCKSKLEQDNHKSIISVSPQSTSQKKSCPNKGKIGIENPKSLHTTNFGQTCYLNYKNKILDQKNNCSNYFDSAIQETRSSVISASPSARSNFSATRHKELLRLVPTNVRVERENTINSEKANIGCSLIVQQNSKAIENCTRSCESLETSLDVFIKEIKDLDATFN